MLNDLRVFFTFIHQNSPGYKTEFHPPLRENETEVQIDEITCRGHMHGK